MTGLQVTPSATTPPTLLLHPELANTLTPMLVLTSSLAHPFQSAIEMMGQAQQWAHFAEGDRYGELVSVYEAAQLLHEGQIRT